MKAYRTFWIAAGGLTALLAAMGFITWGPPSAAAALTGAFPAFCGAVVGVVGVVGARAYGEHREAAKAAEVKP